MCARIKLTTRLFIVEYVGVSARLILRSRPDIVLPAIKARSRPDEMSVPHTPAHITSIAQGQRLELYRGFSRFGIVTNLLFRVCLLDYALGVLERYVRDRRNRQDTRKFG